VGKTGKLYPSEFVQLVDAADERWPVPKIARDLGISPETFRKKRVNQAEINAGDRGGLDHRRARRIAPPSSRSESSKGGA
jgi:hypothetical protein